MYSDHRCLYSVCVTYARARTLMFISDTHNHTLTRGYLQKYIIEAPVNKLLEGRKGGSETYHSFLENFCNAYCE